MRTSKSGCRSPPRSGATARASQANLSNPFGFADFFGSGDAVRVARPVAVAETVGGQDDQVAFASRFFRCPNTPSVAGGLRPALKLRLLARPAYDRVAKLQESIRQNLSDLS